VSDGAETARILTLVFTDLADSTALKTERGDRPVSDLIGRHRAHVERLAADSGGRIIDWAGDGCFLTFETPSAAVLFVLRLQEVHGAEADLPGIRTGIHMGEVSERAGVEGAAPRVEGLAVDLAARICGLAQPGQVLMAAAVADSTQPRLQADTFSQRLLWKMHGPYLLKGFDKPVQIAEVGLEGVAPFEAPVASEKAKPASVASSGAKKPRFGLAAAGSVAAILVLAYFFLPRPPAAVLEAPSPARGPGGAEGVKDESLTVPGFGGRPAIAVLPFDNLSDDPEQEYFADGIAEDLITRLSLWRTFPVIARNSSFRYKDKAVDLKQVSADLGVRYVVEGSVRRAGDRVRVVAQLIDAPSGHHVWAQTYDRQLDDLFALQDEITSKIAASMLGDLWTVESQRALRNESPDLDAWELVQKARWYIERATAKDTAVARTLLERAVELDPYFSEAFFFLAGTHFWDIVFQWTDTPEASLRELFVAARQSVEVDPRAPFGHGALALGFSLTGQRNEMRSAAQRMIEGNPSAPIGHSFMAYSLCGDAARAAESLEMIEKAIRLSPQDPLLWTFYDVRVCAERTLGRNEAALEGARRVVELRPEYSWGHIALASAYAALGRDEEARVALAEALRLQPDLSVDSIRQSMSVIDEDIIDRFIANLRRAGWQS
jgi:TolB-like protein/class 3 adenylate cyclase/tetratricopeptide (TPR) repeat protein